MPFVKAYKARIHYQVDGMERADAPTVVLSNSLGTDLSMWDAQVASLATRFRVVRYDTRGHGQSDEPIGPYSLSMLGEDVLCVMDGLSIKRASFCGLSMGGMTGMWLALNAPERIERLALCNTAAYIGPPATWNARIEVVRAGGMPAITESVLQRWFTARFRTNDSAAVEAIGRTLLSTSPVGYEACCAAIRDADLRTLVRDITHQTMVIAGSHDPSTPPSDGRFVAQQIRGAQYVELDAAHLSNIEARHAFDAALAAFLADPS
jgi:3-oxoadipate enol-lactonase